MGSGPTHRSGATRILRWIGIVALIALMSVGGIALWAWTQRYSLIERQVIVYLDSLGIDADLSIRSATTTQAEIRRIRLSYEGEPFLQIDRLDADYQWRDLLNGGVERLDFTGLNATIEIDENGQVIDGWMPPSTGENATIFPTRGIGLSKAEIHVKSPFGSVPMALEGEVSSPEHFDISGRIETAEIDYQEMEATVTGPFSLSRSRAVPDDFVIESPGLSVSVRHPSATLRRAQLSLNGTINRPRADFRGSASLANGSFAASGVAGAIDAVNINSRSLGAGSQDLSLDVALKRVSISDEDRRREVAALISLSNNLGDVPIVKHYVPQLERIFETLLDGSDISAGLVLNSHESERILRLTTPLELRSGDMLAQLTALPDAPLYRYSQSDPAFLVQTGVTLNAPIPLSLEELRVTVASDNGLQVNGVAAASGTLNTGATWRATTDDGRPVRLDPSSLAFDYSNPETGPSIFKASGAIHYDGDVPGGYVEELSASGRITARLIPQRVALDFAPRGPVRFTRFDALSDWDLLDFEGELARATPLYKQQGNGTARITATLDRASFRAERPANPSANVEAAALAVSAQNAGLNGHIKDAEQVWDIVFDIANLRSPNFPVEDIDATITDGALRAVLSDEGRTQITLESETTDIDTPLAEIAEMSVDLSGTLDAYSLEFDAASVRLKNGTVPALPALGTLAYEEGAFTGTATTRLPKTTNEPVSVTYSFQDGAGEARVEIRDLTFRPRGLQPQDLAPALRGKIASTEGTINSDLIIRFAPDTPLSGSGTLDIVDLSLGTAPGPVTGLSGTVELRTLFPVTTPPGQRLTMERFDPGIPLDDGDIHYALVEGGVDIEGARWPLGDGQITLDPTLWLYEAERNRVTLRVSGVDVGEFLGDIGEGRLSATGVVTGAIPVVVEGIDVRVEQGRIEVREGGLIQYKPRPGEDLADRVGNAGAGQAFKALENFRYDSLFAEIDGPLDGDVTLGLSFTGSNKDVLYDVPFAFDVSVEGELFNIARSLNPNALGNQLVTQVKANRAEENAAEGGGEDTETP